LYLLVLARRRVDAIVPERAMRRSWRRQAGETLQNPCG
jgi:hypothetical protein